METSELKILLIDGSRISYLATRELLLNNSHLKHQLDWIQTYDEAIVGIEREQHDVYLVDYYLDKSTGLDLVRHADTCGIEKPFILLTGESKHEVDVEAMKVGAADYLVKGQLSAKLLERSIRYAVEWKKTEKEMKKLNLDLKASLKNQKKYQAELLHSEKLASVGQLAAGIAHEINTPIQFIGDNVQAGSEMFNDLKELIIDYGKLLDQLDQQGLLVDEVSRIRLIEEDIDMRFLIEDIPRASSQCIEGLQRVCSIVQAMKDFSHPGSSDAKTVFDVNKEIQNTLTVAKSELKYVADIETEFADLPKIQGYPGELNQVFMNILLNAAHAIKDKTLDEKGKISIKTQIVDKEILVWFRDNGCGIPDSILARIFDPFFTTKEVGKGTGQGLAISHNIIVERHGGRIEVESEQGVGTTILVYLPSKDHEEAPQNGKDLHAVH